MIKKTAFGEAEKFTLLGNGDLQAEIITYGATIRALRFKGTDVVLGYDCLEDYRAMPGYMGAAVGRYANRIAGGKFTLNGKEYQLTCNEVNRGGHLHGGNVGIDKRLWNGEETDGKLKLTVELSDGEEGYPGNMTLSVTYEIVDNALRMTYTATTDQDTILNPTNHSYFNLNGFDGAPVTDHVMTLHASHYTPVDQRLVPSGELRPVAGTPFDFTRGKVFGEEIGKHPELLATKGYDHNFVLDGEGFRHVATLVSPTTGIRMECHTDCPGMQICGGNYLNHPVGKAGPMGIYQGLCMEAQWFPDSPNHPEFPTTVLRAGETFTSVTEYRFFQD